MPPRAAQMGASQLPEPGADAQAQSLLLIEQVQQAIADQGGRLPFDQYMEMVLYQPGLGYYTAGSRKFGPSGDFITSPEISSLFAKCLARQCRQVLALVGGGYLLEVGAGSGVLAADLLAELEQLGQLPEAYLILELSPDLRARQREMLQTKAPTLVDRVRWLDTLPEAGFRGVVVANELLDAMPVHRFRLEQGAIKEQFVTSRDEGLALVWDRPVSPGFVEAAAAVATQLGKAGAGYESEINLRAPPWLQELAKAVDAGAVLLIDYGYSRAEYYHPERSRGTLMCHYRHRAHPDPMVYPGLQDITAHVDFSAVAEAALAAGFAVTGFTTQAFFLMGNGLDDLVAASDIDDVVAHMELIQAVKRLTLPSEMGERFKVLGLSLEIDQPLSGFTLRDMRERL